MPGRAHLYGCQRPVNSDPSTSGKPRPTFRSSRQPSRHPGQKAARLRGYPAVRRGADVLAQFRANQVQAKADFRNEQAYLSDVLHRQGKLSYWDDSWCASYKYHCIPAWPTSYWRDPIIPTAARIIIFHGVMNPPDALAGRNMGNWRHARPAQWIAEHWHE